MRIVGDLLVAYGRWLGSHVLLLDDLFLFFFLGDFFFFWLNLFDLHFLFFFHLNFGLFLLLFFLRRCRLGLSIFKFFHSLVLLVYAFIGVHSFALIFSLGHLISHLSHPFIVPLDLLTERFLFLCLGLAAALLP